jgi:hypothetical protein
MMVRSWRPFDVVARVLAERLRGCEPSEQLRSLIHSQSTDWQRVVGHASIQFVLPAFGAALHDLDLIGSLDEELGAFLRAVHAANLERNCEIGDELVAAVGILNRAGIDPALLKGAIRLVDGLYPDHGWRMLRDLDLLVPEARFEEAIKVLQVAGYAIAGEVDESVVSLRRPNALIEVELHRELFRRPKEVRVLPAHEVLDQARLLRLGDVAFRLPSIEHQIVHLIGHSQIRHRGHAYGRISLRDRLEAAALMHPPTETLDWQHVAARFTGSGYRRLLLTFLLSLNDSFPLAVPVPAKIDPLTTLQYWRTALQARSTTVASIGLWAAYCAVTLRWQITDRDAGRLKATKNIKRLMLERGAGRRLIQVFFDNAPRPW